MLNNIRNALRHVFYSTYLQLASSTSASKKYCDLWVRLGENYMIQPESTLNFCKAQRRCCNIFCARSALETAKLRCCKRCKEMYYCGRECQKMCAFKLAIQPTWADVGACSHWSGGHKFQCGQSSLHNTQQGLDDEMPRKKFEFPVDKI